MARTIAIGIQNFSEMIENRYFYIDKTYFIRQWWESGDSVTLITRPRRFGKTLTMSMVEQFFSVDYAGRRDLFTGLSVSREEKYRNLQGTYPVISLSFANVKERNYGAARKMICQLLAKLYTKHLFLLDSGLLSETDKNYFKRVSENMDGSDAALALYQMSDFLYRYYGKKVIILLDEYDTPMQEAYVNGYWEELAAFIRSLFNPAFKTNPWLERGIMTGITGVCRESVFSDLNHLEVVTTTSNKYADSFGFNEEEVFAAMDEFGLHEREKVKYWYDGFTFGNVRDIYNPWSILNYLDKRALGAYWANTSSNNLVGKLIREGSVKIKQAFEDLLHGRHLFTAVEEQIVYDQLNDNEQAIWSLLLASGYLKAVDYEKYEDMAGFREPMYELALTNHEVRYMFGGMIKGWFGRAFSDYNDFVKALLSGDIDAMNEYMNRITLEIFSYFDTGKNLSRKAEPERFYHGFVLGLFVELEERYAVTSNRESGFGRYDIMLIPKKSEEDAFIIEFKVFNEKRERDLEDTLRAALAQIENMKYEAALIQKGIPQERIYTYGFAFMGKTVLIGQGTGEG